MYSIITPSIEKLSIEIDKLFWISHMYFFLKATLEELRGHKVMSDKLLSLELTLRVSVYLKLPG